MTNVPTGGSKMSTTIWKASLNVVNEPQIVSMPVGATIIRVAQQSGYPTIWFKFKNNWGENEKCEGKFLVVGTGQPFDDNYMYLGSCDCDPYVWHVLLM